MNGKCTHHEMICHFSAALFKERVIFAVKLPVCRSSLQGCREARSHTTRFRKPMTGFRPLSRGQTAGSVEVLRDDEHTSRHVRRGERQWL